MLAAQLGLPSIFELPRGIRNNNPLNIVKSAIAWLGEKDGLPESSFEQFDTPEHGLRAGCKLLLTYQRKHGCDTITKIITRWAPPKENNTAEYIRIVAAGVGVTKNEPINLSNVSRLFPLALEMVRHENGIQPYPTDMIWNAALNALGRAEGGARAEELTGIAEEGLASVRRYLELAGKAVTITKQPNGLFSVLATG